MYVMYVIKIDKLIIKKVLIIYKGSLNFKQELIKMGIFCKHSSAINNKKKQNLSNFLTKIKISKYPMLKQHLISYLIISSRFVRYL